MLDRGALHTTPYYACYLADQRSQILDVDDMVTTNDRTTPSFRHVLRELVFAFRERRERTLYLALPRS